MPRSSGRGQVEPLAALAALAVLGLAFSAYTTAFRTARPAPADQDVAGPALTRTVEQLRPDVAVRPGRLDRSEPPDGYRLNVTLRAAGRVWTRGPAPPSRADAARRVVPVRIDRTTVRPGVLRVEVWR